MKQLFLIAILIVSTSFSFPSLADVVNCSCGENGTKESIKNIKMLDKSVQKITNIKKIESTCRKAYEHFEISKDHIIGDCVKWSTDEIDAGRDLAQSLKIACEKMSKQRGYATAYYCYQEAAFSLEDVYPYKLLSTGCYLPFARYTGAGSLELKNAYKCYTSGFAYIFKNGH